MNYWLDPVLNSENTYILVFTKKKNPLANDGFIDVPGDQRTSQTQPAHLPSKGKDKLCCNRPEINILNHMSFPTSFN